MSDPRSAMGGVRFPDASPSIPGDPGAGVGRLPHGLDVGSLPAPTFSHRDDCLEALHELLPSRWRKHDLSTPAIVLAEPLDLKVIFVRTETAIDARDDLARLAVAGGLCGSHGRQGPEDPAVDHFLIDGIAALGTDTSDAEHNGRIWQCDRELRM